MLISLYFDIVVPMCATGEHVAHVVRCSTPMETKIDQFQCLILFVCLGDLNS